MISVAFRYALWWPMIKKHASHVDCSDKFLELEKKLSTMLYIIISCFVLFIVCIIMLIDFFLRNLIPRFIFYALLMFCISLSSFYESSFFEVTKGTFFPLSTIVHHQGSSYGTTDVIWQTKTGEFSMYDSSSARKYSNSSTHSKFTSKSRSKKAGTHKLFKTNSYSHIQEPVALT